MADSRPTFFFEITTPERTVFSAEVVQVSLPTRDGEITVLAHHLPIVSLLKSGELRIVPKSGDTMMMAVSGGFIEVQGNKVIVLADTAEHAHEIDEERAERARARAQELMADHQDEESSATATAELEKNLARLHVARRHRRYHEGRPPSDH